MKEQQSPVSLSVIVCCYNVEHYLDQSLQCLEKQWGNRTDYEIILVNDGSKDGTINKLNDFKERHPDHVKVIDKQQNGGLAAARNSALDIAQGTWVAFFDPDDVLAELGYCRLLEIVDNYSDVDLLRYGMQVVDVGQEMTVPVLSEPLSVVWEGSSVEDMLQNSYGVCTCYLINREMLGDRRFPTNMIVEDLLFIVPILLEGKKVIKTDAKIYYYIIRTDSATFISTDYKKLSRQSDDISHAIEAIEGLKQGQPDEIKRRLLDKQQLMVHNMSTRMLLSNKGAKDIKKIVQSMKELNLFPLPGGGKMVQIMNYIYSHLWCLPVLRPAYRLFHRIKNYLRY